jgi:hypothetical protein
MKRIIISDPKLDPFYDQNPNFDILNADLKDLEADEDTIELLKKYQRLLQLKADPDIAQALINTWDSAYKIASVPKDEFIEQCKPLLRDRFSENDLDMIATEIHRAAVAVKNKTKLLWANIKDTVASPYFRALRVSAIADTDDDDIINEFENIPSYQEMLGDLDYLDCDHCQSILSPSAYFVDLMRVVDEYIPHSTLDDRRPDLAQIDLTGEKTYSLVPSLHIINTILESQGAFGNKDALHTLATAPYPFGLPFNYPLEQIRAYLGQQNTDLASIYKAFNADETSEAYIRESLGLSIEEYGIVTTPKTQATQLRKCYGVASIEVDDQGKITEDIFQEIVGKIGLSAAEISELLYQNLSQPELESRAAVESDLNQKDKVPFFIDADALTLHNLDRINRFVRLAKKLDWSFSDLDWVLRSINCTEIDTQTLQKIVQIKQAQEQYRLPLDVLCSFWYDIKTIGQGEGPQSKVLFDRIFNNPLRLKDKSLVYHPKYSSNPLYTDDIAQWNITESVTEELSGSAAFGQSRLLAALQVNPTQLLEISEAIWGKGSTVDLTVENLSVLFRHTQLLKLLKRDFHQYQILSNLILRQSQLEASRPASRQTSRSDTRFGEGLSNDQIQEGSLRHFLEIVSLNQWCKTVGLQPADLDYIVHQTPSPSIQRYYSHLDWGNLDGAIRTFVEDLWLNSTPLLATPQSFVNEAYDLDPPTADAIFDQLVENGHIQLIGEQPLSETSGLISTTIGSLVLFAGGYDQYLTNQGSPTVDMYDAQSHEWLPSTTTGQLSYSRGAGAATSVGNLAIFAGGYRDDEPTNTGTRGEMPKGEVIDIFDANTKTWSTQPIEETTEARTLEGRISLAATSVGNQAIFAGGFSRLTYEASDAVNIYDASQELWLKDPGHLSMPRWNLAATTVGNLAIFAGGWNWDGGSDVVDIYNPNAPEGQQWTTERLSMPRHGLAATTVGDKAIFAGGWSKTGWSDVVDIYDTKTGQWSSIHLSHARGTLAATSIGHQVFFAGGFGDGKWSDVLEIYDFQEKTWLPSQTLSEPRGHLVAIGACNQAIFAGGYGDHLWSKTVDIYDGLSQTLIPKIHELFQARSRLATTNTWPKRRSKAGIVSAHQLKTSLVSFTLDGVHLSQSVRDFIKTTLAQLHDVQHQFLNDQLATVLKSDASLVVPLLSWATQATEFTDFWPRLLTPVPTGSEAWKKTLDTFTFSLRLSLLAKKLDLSAIDLATIGDRPEAYDLTDSSKLSLANIKTIGRFKQLMNALNDRHSGLSTYFAIRATTLDTVTTLRASLGLSNEESSFLTPDTPADQATLSKFYGVDLSVDEYGGLADIEVFQQQSHLSIADLTFLKENHYLVVEEIPLDEDITVVKIGNLSDKVLDHLGRFITLAHKLDWSFADLSYVLTLINGTAKEVIDQIRINDDVLNQISQIKRVLDALTLSLTDYASITTSLVDQPVQLGKFYGLLYIAEKSIDYLSDVKNFREKTGLSREEIEQLIRAVNSIQKSNTEDGLQEAELAISSDMPSKITNLSAERLDQMRQFLLLAQKLNWSYETLSWLWKHDNNSQFISLDFLVKIAQIKDVQHTYNLKLNTTEYQDLFDLSKGNDRDESSPLKPSDLFFLIALAELFRTTGWQPRQFFAHSANMDKGLDIAQSVQALLTLYAGLNLSNLSGIPISFMAKLLDLQNLTADKGWKSYKSTAQSLIEAIQSNYTDESWEKVNKAIEERLNERKRDALTGFILWKQNIENLRELSQYLLMDVETSGILSTSYILQATLSVQQYLHRCRMGLETGVTALKIPEIWWKWMMNYRVWEANRKVFLYPENYIDPSLRKTKTSIFQELEDELLQSEITLDSVETAYRDYFEKFTELAHLKIVDSYRCNIISEKNASAIENNNDITSDKNESEEDTLFLFGRTVTDPYTYYYRKCIQPTANKPTWEPWEKIELAINSDIIRGCYAFNRLFIFWVETTQIEKREEVYTSSEGSQTIATTETKATIKYSFQKVNGTWIQTQSLVKDIVLEDYDENIGGSLWQKVYLLPLSSEDPEKILTIFGNLIEEEEDYKTLAYTTILTIDLLKENKPITLKRSEISDDFKLFAGRVKSGKLALRKRDNVLYDNYAGDSINRDSGQGLIGYWPIHDGEGTTISEKANYNLAGKLKCLVHSPQWEKENSPVTLKLDWGEYVELPEAPRLKLTNSDFTVEAWVKADELPDGKDSAILGTECNTDNQGLHLVIRDERAYMGFWDNDLSGQTILEPRKWIYLVWRYRKFNGEQAIFVNGKKDANAPDHAPFQGTDPVLIGKAYEDRSFKGQIAEVRIWDRALSQEEIENFFKENEHYYPDVSNNSNSSSGQTLLEKISNDYSSVSTVKNQPGWFIFDNGDEAFLATPEEIDLPRISDSVNALDEHGTIKLSYNAINAMERIPEALQVSFTRLTTSTIRDLSTNLLLGGIDKLLSLESQRIPELDFERFESDKDSVIPPNTLQLDFDGPYGMYFREIFFHIPFLVANTLNANQRFEEAQKWYHYIFNPIIQSEVDDGLDNPHPSDRFWRFLPFRGNSIQKLDQLLMDDQAIKAYNNNPFDPHAIAQLRIGAYEKAIVMKYIDNILDWGDQLFAQDTREAIAQASILYLLAYDLLGDKPEILGKRPTPLPITVEQIRNKREQGEEIPQFLIELESHVSRQDLPKPQLEEFENDLVTFPFSDVNAYFCVGENKEFLAYWERVEDRLYKIRHSQNIEGIFRQLALFQPPIDPNQLVRAFAVGGGSARFLSQLKTTIPHYRFDYMLERARTITSSVIQLGASLLSALEKKDAEELSLLRSAHEQVTLQLITGIKRKQIEEANETLNSLKQSLKSAEVRYGHYHDLITEGCSFGEVIGMALMGRALLYQLGSTKLLVASSILHAIPTIFGTSSGGAKPGDSVGAVSQMFQNVANIYNQSSGLADKVASYQRREEEWELQKKLAEIDIQQIEYQIEAQKIRKNIAERDLEVHEKSIEQSQELENFFKDKFSNKERYQWMVGSLSYIYSKTYEMALEMAISAQNAYGYELNDNHTFIKSDAWDSLHQGLLAGERLMLGLHQLEKAYIDNNVRRLKIEKTISLFQLNPFALQQLKALGKCEFQFDERLFDYDFPGHYCRQIKNLTISIPAVAGPYQNIHATLTQTSNKTLLKPDVSGVEFLLHETDEIPVPSILRSNWRRNQKIAISRGVNDNGLFELGFQGDARYLPFEGTGVVSTWELDMPKAANPIDYNTISDVVITLRYTAIDGGSQLQETVKGYLSKFTGQSLLSLRQQLRKGHSSDQLSFAIPSNLFRRNLRNPSITNISLCLRLADGQRLAQLADSMTLKVSSSGSVELKLTEIVEGIVLAESELNETYEDIGDQSWLLSVSGQSGFFALENVVDIVVLMTYEGEVEW